MYLCKLKFWNIIQPKLSFDGRGAVELYNIA